MALLGTRAGRRRPAPCAKTTARRRLASPKEEHPGHEDARPTAPRTVKTPGHCRKRDPWIGEEGRKGAGGACRPVAPWPPGLHRPQTHPPSDPRTETRIAELAATGNERCYVTRILRPPGVRAGSTMAQERAILPDVVPNRQRCGFTSESRTSMRFAKHEVISTACPKDQARMDQAEITSQKGPPRCPGVSKHPFKDGPSALSQVPHYLHAFPLPSRLLKRS